MISLDEALRPKWIFGQTLHEVCDRGGYYESKGSSPRSMGRAIVS